MKIALAGNPNSGKTTLFNAITGRMEYVGNWPGVTVEKKVAYLKRQFKVFNHGHGGHMGMHGHGKGHNRVSIVDLPGAYSISPFTSEEAVTSDFILSENPDVIINIIDSGSLERSLFFTTQLLELGIPVVICLNKQDVLQRQGSRIDVAGLSAALHCDIAEVTANEGIGLQELVSKAIRAAGDGPGSAPEFAGKGTAEEDKARQKFIKVITDQYLLKDPKRKTITLTDKIDRIVASPYWGLPIFALIMWAVYALSISGLGGLLSGYIGDRLFGEIIPAGADGFLESIGVHSLLRALIVDGAIGGVGAVLGFLPLIMVLFFSLALLEDSGYMARVAMVMDRYFKRIGLSGKSVIPMVVGSGCSVPGIMATRTIEDDRQRIATVMLTPFIPCGAKLPIIALMAAVFFPGATWVFPTIYLMAGAIIIAGGLLLKQIFGLEGSTTFIIELPEYKAPSLKHAARQMVSQAKAFIIKAATIILVMNTLVWFLQTYGWHLKTVSDPGASILASLGSVIAPLLIPLGFIGWQMAAAIMTGFVAKENVVATLAVILAASEDILTVPGGPLTELFTPVTAFAFIAFNLFTPPCFAAIGAMNSELGGRKWLLRAILFQLGVGYYLAMFIAQIGTWIFYGKTLPGFLPAVAMTAAAVMFIIYLLRRKNAKISGTLSGSIGGDHA